LIKQANANADRVVLSGWILSLEPCARERRGNGFPYQLCSISDMIPPLSSIGRAAFEP